MRRRLDLIASFVVPRPVMLLDEPTTGLDPRSRNEIWSTVRDLVADGTTVVLTTQYLEEADQLADNVVIIDHGRCVATGSPEDLKAAIGVRVDIEVHDRGRTARGGNGSRCIDRPESRRSTPTVFGSAHRPSIGNSPCRVSSATSTTPASPIRDAAIRRPTLDEVFLHLTGNQQEHDATESAA